MSCRLCSNSTHDHWVEALSTGLTPCNQSADVLKIRVAQKYIQLKCLCVSCTSCLFILLYLKCEAGRGQDEGKENGHIFRRDELRGRWSSTFQKRDTVEVNLLLTVSKETAMLLDTFMEDKCLRNNYKACEGLISGR